MRRKLGCALALFALATVEPSRGEVPPDLVGRPIVTIEFESPLSLDEEALRELLTIRVGEPLAMDALDASVAGLRTKEIFDAIETVATPVPGGVALQFRLRPTDIVVEIGFDGESAISEEELRRRSGLREGDLVPEKRREEARRRLEELYASRGFPRAATEVRIQREAAAAVRLEFAIEEGEPVRLERIDLTIDGAVDPEEIRRVLPFEPGSIWSNESLAEGEAALRRWLRGRGFFECDVLSLESIEGTRAIPEYKIRVNARSALEVDGNVAIDDAALLGVLDLGARPVITAGTWREMARRMGVLYEERGHPFARVSVTVDEGEPRTVRFRIEEGPRIRLRRVRLQGNRWISDRRLREVMETRPASRWPFSTGGTIVGDVLAEDIERIRERYRAEGFLAARVADVRFELDLERGEIEVTILVAEGERSRLARLAVRGAESLPERVEISKALRDGAPYRAASAEAERFRVLERVRSMGYPDARVTIESTIREGADGSEEVDLAFVVAPGPEVRVGRIVVQRNFYTRDRVVRRELDLAPGDRLDPTALLEAQARIYRLGLLRSASVEAAQTEGSVRDVHLGVAERPGGELQYGFGYNTSTGLRSFLQLGHRNVAGTGRALSLRGDLNLSRSDFTPDEYLGDAGLRVPRLFESRWDGRANLVAQHRERDVDEFSIERFGVSTGVEREVVPSLKASFLVELDDSRIFDVAPDVVLTGKDVGRLRTVTLNPILVFDGRDDAFAPTRGVFDSARLRYGAKAFGSEVGFVKLTAQHAQYVPVVRGVTWLYSIRAGIAEALEGTGSVPLRERFFLGGRNSVRGFDENEIGPRGDEGNPVGGDLSINVNTEIRFPLAFGVDGAVFFDGGGLYLREEAVTFDEFREGVGPGLRYQTPIGALSLDYGFKLDRRDDESIGEVHFSIGTAF